MQWKKRSSGSFPLLSTDPNSLCEQSFPVSQTQGFSLVRKITNSQRECKIHMQLHHHKALLLGQNGAYLSARKQNQTGSSEVLSHYNPVYRKPKPSSVFLSRKKKKKKDSTCSASKSSFHLKVYLQRNSSLYFLLAIACLQ